jgi:hypothetical protein
MMAGYIKDNLYKINFTGMENLYANSQLFIQEILPKDTFRDMEK